MPNPLAKYLPLIKQHAIGLAQDFWKDGDEVPFFTAKKEPWELPDTPEELAASKATASPKSPASKGPPPKPMWHAAPGEISERMFGEGWVTPGDAIITDKLITPLGLTKEMSVLDLSAGLGGRMRKTSAETGAYITGLEPDAEIAARGMEMSIKAGKGKHAPVAHYDPANLAVSRMYDCMLARETFYRVADKPELFKTIAAAVKQKGQVAFTDYIVNPESREQPAVKAWQAAEKGATPLSLIEMAEAWAKVEFNLRVNEDMTDFYKNEVAQGLKRLSKFLASGVLPDPDTRKSLQRRMEVWSHRAAAMEQGLRFFRFYGTKK